jgi:hypothetical protein
MLVFRHLVVVSAGAVFALGYGVPAISQESLTVDSSADSSADRSVDESPSLGSSHFSSNINFSPSAVTEKLNKNSISKVGEREAQSAETRERVVLDKTRNLNGTEEINPEEINPDETSFPDVTLNASEAPEAAIIKPVVPADSALELSWEADIPQLTPEITEDLAQNPSIPETSRSPELLANETFLLSQEEVDLEPSRDRLDSENENEEVDLEPSRDRLDSENENEEDNPETFVDEVSPLLEEPSI